jgi:hypothetical protein
MISPSTKLFIAAIGVAALIAVPVVARMGHIHAAPANQADGSAGKGIDAQTFQNKADQLRRGVVCDMDGSASNCLMLPMNLINSNKASALTTNI